MRTRGGHGLRVPPVDFGRARSSGPGGPRRGALYSIPVALLAGLLYIIPVAQSVRLRRFLFRQGSLPTPACSQPTLPAGIVTRLAALSFGTMYVSIDESIEPLGLCCRSFQYYHFRILIQAVWSINPLFNIQASLVARNH